MPLVRFSIDTSGLEAARVAVGLAAQELPRLREMQDERIHPILLNWMDRKFRGNGAAFGDSPWVDYSREPKFRAFKRRSLSAARGEIPRLRWVAGPASQPIQEHERLARSFTEPHHEEHVWVSTDRGFEFGSSVPYAANHQFGMGTQPWDKSPIPRRPILTNNARVIRAVVNAYQSYADEVLESTVEEQTKTGTKMVRASGVRRARVRATRADVEAALGGGGL